MVGGPRLTLRRIPSGRTSLLFRSARVDKMPQDLRIGSESTRTARSCHSGFRGIEHHDRFVDLPIHNAEFNLVAQRVVAVFFGGFTFNLTSGST